MCIVTESQDMARFITAPKKAWGRLKNAFDPGTQSPRQAGRGVQTSPLQLLATRCLRLSTTPTLSNPSNNTLPPILSPPPGFVPHALLLLLSSLSLLLIVITITISYFLPGLARRSSPRTCPGPSGTGSAWSAAGPGPVLL